MVTVFSYSLFGTLDKYCKGMLRNVEEITKRFPDAEIWVYCGTDVPESILSSLKASSNVKLFFTNETGHVVKIFRYLPIDNPNVDICIVRDADSRVTQRDEQSIRDFLQTEKLTQIVRDHKVHTVPILGGMVSFRKGALPYAMRDLIAFFFTQDLANKVFEFEDDQNFLRKYVYPLVIQKALIQDEYDQPFEHPSMHVKISTPRVFPDFVGQVYDFNEKGEEFTVCGP